MKNPFVCDFFDKVIFTRFNKKLIESKMTSLEQLSLNQTISRVDSLIDGGNGDAGRLYHILEFLKNNKPLYQSDKIYLENKLESSFSVEEEHVEVNPILPKIKELIDSGNGDPGRLQYIYDTLANDKTLYHSDSIYLQSKLNSSINDVEHESKKQTLDTIPLKPKKKVIEYVEKQTLESKPLEKIKGSMPKGWSLESSSGDVEKITKDIELEKQKIKTQEKISNEITQQRFNLSQLISHRQDYEKKITQEKSSLELQIKEERIKIQTQTKLSNEIVTQKEELEKVKKERSTIIEKLH